jgi:plastocyanin
MSGRVLSSALLILTVGPFLRANDIDGTIVVQHKLTKRKVTASADLYQRGAAVKLGADREQDPLDYERSHVVVYVEGDLPSSPITAELTQQDRRFAPDLVVVPAGSTVSFPNMDPIFHNVFSLSKAKSFDLGNYPQGKTRTVVFPKPGIVFVDCHLHPNMSAVIVVTPNRWSTKADASGRFVLPDLPPGTYTVVAWHKTAGFFRKTVRVTDAGNAAVEFLIPLGEDGAFQEARK